MSCKEKLSMNVLVIGKGGREHALVRALYQSPSVDQIMAIPGNDGMKKEALCAGIKEPSDMISFCKKMSVDLVVIGPEAEIVSGLPDLFRDAGFLVFAPSKEAAALEASKIFSKQFMKEGEVPTSRAFVVENLEEVKARYKEFSSPWVLKADGLAAGKGVFICQTEEELFTASEKLFKEQIFGEAGKRALLEEYQAGWELSCHVLTNGSEYQLLPLVQDHKRLLDGQKGPNTGGMGTVAPYQISEDLLQQVKKRVIEPSIQLIERKKLFYRGVLFIGMMITEKGPIVLEYNVRFGDPETQVLMPLLDGDWAEVFYKIARGEVPDLRWKDLYATCVVLAAKGYPQNPVKGDQIFADLDKITMSSYFLHAGTAFKEGRWVVNGGRVLNAIGLGSSLEESIREAYKLAESVQWPGMQMRKDIGKWMK
ncbi:MAG: phosphoribosylamine--glycine ligase [Bdellovibrio sp.]|nr:MAG: phosphoribosylamine--glycine ligase [Bdellovibrio sp.]